MFFANPTQKILTISRRGKRERTEITYRSTITYKIKNKKKPKLSVYGHQSSV